MSSNTLESNSHMLFFSKPSLEGFKSIDLFDIQNFSKTATTPKINSSFKHPIDVGHIPESKSLWYRKEALSPSHAKREVLAQELFRIFIPRQPITKLAFHPLNNIYYVLSEEIVGFKPLAEKEEELMSDSNLIGLGRIMFLAYFLQEADLKNGNIGIGDNQHLYKIDGDWAFSSIRNPGQFPEHTSVINKFQINNLPYLRNYHAHNWLDIVIERKLNASSKILKLNSFDSESFSQEKLEMILKIILTPKVLWEKITSSFFSGDSDLYLSLLITRQEKLLTTVREIDEFKAYLIDSLDKINAIKNDFIEHIKNFKLQGNLLLFNDRELSLFILEINSILELLVEEFSLQKKPLALTA